MGPSSWHCKHWDCKQARVFLFFSAIICSNQSGRSVSQLGTEKLAAIESASRSMSASLLVVRSDVSAMTIPLQGISNALSGIHTRVDGLEAGLHARVDGLENLVTQLLGQSPAFSGASQTAGSQSNAPRGVIQLADYRALTNY